MAPRTRIRHPAARRPSEVSRALEAARLTTRLSCAGLGRALQLHPRTVSRWEQGASRPKERQWTRILSFYAARDPDLARKLADVAARPLPVPVVAPTIPRDVAIRVVARAADALDVAPKRVREVLRAAAHAATEEGARFELVVQAMSEDGDDGRVRV